MITIHMIRTQPLENCDTKLSTLYTCKITKCHIPENSVIKLRTVVRTVEEYVRNCFRTRSTTNTTFWDAEIQRLYVYEY